MPLVKGGGREGAMTQASSRLGLDRITTSFGRGRKNADNTFDTPRSAIF